MSTCLTDRTASVIVNEAVILLAICLIAELAGLARAGYEFGATRLIGCIDEFAGTNSRVVFEGWLGHGLILLLELGRSFVRSLIRRTSNSFVIHGLRRLLRDNQSLITYTPRQIDLVILMGVEETWHDLFLNVFSSFASNIATIIIANLRAVA